MRRVNKSWMVVVATLLLGVLAGVVWAGPNDRPQAADITRKVTLAGSDFVPHDEGNDWLNEGNYVECETGKCEFTAPVVFPCLPSVTVERIKLHVDDQSSGNSASANLFRTNPSNGRYLWLGEAESPTEASAGLQTYSSGAINAVVWPSQRAYIHLYVGYDVYVYGVTVEYHRNI